MIEVNIQKSLKLYQGRQVLNINHRFATGSITKIHGPSGAGKTTLLKIIAGLIEADKGRVVADNCTWLDTSQKINLPPQKRVPGFVFQDYALFPNMTVLQHLQYAADDASWISHLLEFGKLDKLSNHKPIHLSGGQQQRLAILRALAIKPKLILMDEPFSALDPEMKTDLISGLKTVFEDLNATALIVSHNPYELEGLATDDLYINPVQDTLF